MIDNSKEYYDNLMKQTIVGLKAIGLKAEGYAKDDCPVDTGRLRNSITNKVVKEGETNVGCYIGSNVEYASKIELDEKIKHETGKAHFLRDSATTHSDEYNELLTTALKG